jgi:hypothetical protein
MRLTSSSLTLGLGRAPGDQHTATRYTTDGSKHSRMRIVRVLAGGCVVAAELHEGI